MSVAKGESVTRKAYLFRAGWKLIKIKWEEHVSLEWLRRRCRLEVDVKWLLRKANVRRGKRRRYIEWCEAIKCIWVMVRECKMCSALFVATRVVREEQTSASLWNKVTHEIFHYHSVSSFLLLSWRCANNSSLCPVSQWQTRKCALPRSRTGSLCPMQRRLCVAREEGERRRKNGAREARGARGARGKKK